MAEHPTIRRASRTARRAALERDAARRATPAPPPVRRQASASSRLDALHQDGRHVVSHDPAVEMTADEPTARERDLRRPDRFARGVLATQSNAPRHIRSHKIVWMIVSNSFFWLVIFCLILSIVNVDIFIGRYEETEIIFHSRSVWAVFGMPLLTLYLIGQKGLFIYRYFTPIQRGHIALAVVETVQIRVQELRHDATMTLHVKLASGEFGTPWKDVVHWEDIALGVTNWLSQLQVGDEVVVLVHPTKAKVLAAIGPLGDDLPAAHAIARQHGITRAR
jgi:hypothetical protein